MQTARLDEFAARVLDAGWAPATSVAVTDAKETLTARTYGAAPDALWPVASIGKSFTAVIALQLVDEGLLYAQRLAQAGVPVECITYAGMVHAFFQHGGFVPRARDAHRDAAAALARALAG